MNLQHSYHTKTQMINPSNEVQGPFKRKISTQRSKNQIHLPAKKDEQYYSNEIYIGNSDFDNTNQLRMLTESTSPENPKRGFLTNQINPLIAQQKRAQGVYNTDLVDYQMPNLDDFRPEQSMALARKRTQIPKIEKTTCMQIYFDTIRENLVTCLLISKFDNTPSLQNTHRSEAFSRFMSQNLLEEPEISK